MRDTYKKRSVIIIGAGIGGITAAAHLAQRGFHVKIFEKRETPGGRCSQFSKDGHTFDIGATLFVMPGVYKKAFSDLGENIEDHLDLRRIDPTYHLHFGDNSKLALTSDPVKMEAQLESIEPGSLAQFLRYFEEGHRHYDLSMRHLVDRSFNTPFTFFHPRMLPLLFQVKALKNHYRNVSGYFNDPRLRSAFTFQDMYCGLSPYEAPSTFSLLSYTDLAHGVWYPDGGIHSVIKALVRIAEDAGCEFILGNPVARIDTAGGIAEGVTLSSGERHRADVVLANADLPYVYLFLLGKETGSPNFERKRYSCSTISFFWGLDQRYEQLSAHSLFLSRDYRGSSEKITNQHTLPEEPSFYLHAPARCDPAMAPAGEDTMIAIVPVGHIEAAVDQDWDEFTQRARAAVITRLAALGIRDIESHIKFEVRITPEDWRSELNLHKGATHGLSHHLTQMACFRPANRHRRLHNLYFVGASTHPGTGVPCALISARLVAERICNDSGIIFDAVSG
jgi:phytoene desaturase